MILTASRNCQAVYFGESKRSLKSCSNEHVRSVKNISIEKNEITKQSWKEGHNFDWNQREVIITYTRPNLASKFTLITQRN